MGVCFLAQVGRSYDFPLEASFSLRNHVREGFSSGELPTLRPSPQPSQSGSEDVSKVGPSPCGLDRRATTSHPLAPTGLLPSTGRLFSGSGGRVRTGNAARCPPPSSAKPPPGANPPSRLSWVPRGDFRERGAPCRPGQGEARGPERQGVCAPLPTTLQALSRSCAAAL